VLVRESSLTVALLVINDCARQCNRLPGIKPGTCDRMRRANVDTSENNMCRDNVRSTTMEDYEEESDGYSAVTIPTKEMIFETCGKSETRTRART
jgi:hypothetical protein